MEETDPRHLLAETAKILDSLKIPYMVTGGMAVLVWGRLRFTADIDIVVELAPKHIDRLAAALKSVGEYGYIDKDVMQRALANGGEFNFIDGGTGVKVDFWVLSKGSFDKQRLQRRIKKEILGRAVYFISPEDLILSKPRWFKESDSSRHLEDVQSIVTIQGDSLDRAYLREWAQKQSTAAILDRILLK